MKKFVFAGLGLALINLPASAADLPVKAAPPVVAPIYNWTGFYVGVSAGGIWTDRDDRPVLVSGPPGPNSTPAQNAIAPLTRDEMNSWLAGGQIGFNWQTTNRVVLGIEADISGTDLRSWQSIMLFTPTIGAGPKDITTTLSQHLDYFGTVRGRAGYAFDNLLLYVTGGLAYGGGNASLGVASATGFGRVGIPFNLVASDSFTRVGWTVGVGTEATFAWFGPNWSVKGEYLYYDLGREHLAVTHTVTPPPGFTATIDPEFRGGLIRVGLNYRFGATAVVAKY